MLYLRRCCPPRPCASPSRTLLLRLAALLLLLSLIPVFIVRTFPGTFAYHCLRIAAGFLGFGWCHPVVPPRTPLPPGPPPPSWANDAAFWANFPCPRASYRVWLPEGPPPKPADTCDSLIVTAFFDIGRSQWPFLARSSGEYLDNMKGVLAVRNPMVFFTSPDLAEGVLEARRRHGLADRTMVVAHELQCASQAWLLPGTEALMCSPEATARMWTLNPNLAVPERQEPWYNVVLYMKAGLVRAAASLPQPALAGSWITWLDAGCHAPMCPPGLLEGRCLNPAPYARRGRVRIAQAGVQSDALAAMTPTQWTRQHVVLFAGTIFGASRQHAAALMDGFLDTLQWMLTRGVADYDQTVFAWWWVRAPEQFDAYSLSGNWHNIVRSYAGWDIVGEEGEYIEQKK